jgi:hypothetical protein
VDPEAASSILSCCDFLWSFCFRSIPIKILRLLVFLLCLGQKVFFFLKNHKLKTWRTAGFFDMWSLSSNLRKKFIVDQLPELGRRMAHAAAARGQDKEQHL